MIHGLLIRIALATSLIGAVSGATAATYPDRPVRIIVPYAAGGGTDIIARILAERMAGPLGQREVAPRI